MWRYSTRIYFAALRALGFFPAPQTSSVSDKIVYLSFDDGPSPYTEALLTVLERYHVKATFFVTHRPNYLEILPKIAAAGHSIGNHTACHEYKTLYASETSFLDALRTMEEAILEKTGVQPTLFRFPGGSASINHHASQEGMAHRLTTLVETLGYRYFDWTLDSRDTAEATTAYAVYRTIIAGIQKQPVSLVLQHDIKPFSVAAVERVIVWGLRHGYRVLPLDDTVPAVHHVISPHS